MEKSGYRVYETRSPIVFRLWVVHLRNQLADIQKNTTKFLDSIIYNETGTDRNRNQRQKENKNKKKQEKSQKHYGHKKVRKRRKYRSNH